MGGDRDDLEHRVGDGVEDGGLIEAARAQQILKDVPTPMLINAFGGSVRETASMLRSGVLARTDEHLAMAFGLCWDGIKA